MFGIQSGWTAPTLVKLRDSEDFTVTNKELSTIATSHEIGRFFGPLLVFILVDRIGRKYVLATCAFSFFISWLIMVFAHSVPLICCLRMLQGATQGMNITTCSIFVVENCTPKLRGIMISSILIFTNVAIIIEYVLTTYTSFATAATVNAVVGFCGLSTSFFLRETPYFLVMKGYHEVAKKNLMWLRGKRIFDSETESELSKINENIQLELLKKNSAVNVLTISENYKPLLTIVILRLLTIMAGCSAIMAYSAMIFQPSSMFSPSEYTIIKGIFPLLISVVLPFIIEKFNRRSLLLGMSSSLVISHVSSLCLSLAKVYISGECFSWLMFITISVSITANTMMMIMVGIISGELLAMSVKAIGNSLGAQMISIGGTITVAIFLPIADAYGIEYNFLIYSISSVLFFAFVLIVLPETRGKSLVDIQNSLQAKGRETN